MLPEAAALPLPESLDDPTAVALLDQGATAIGVVEAAGLGPADTVLVQAAAGGVGSLLVQLARRAGATVIAAARGDRKRELARHHGAHVVVDSGEPDWPRRVGEAVDGSVTVVLERTGGAVSQAAFDLLAPGVGRMVIYGTASGQPPRIDPLAVAAGCFGRSSAAPWPCRRPPKPTEPPNVAPPSERQSYFPDRGRWSGSGSRSGSGLGSPGRGAKQGSLPGRDGHSPHGHSHDPPR